MPSVTYNGQSFAVDGRRIWLLGASIQYARIPAAFWADRIAAARQAGFNLVETACAWMVHEPRRGRYVFEDDADVRRFLELCAEAEMRVLLRVGPYVGSGFDGGGLPAWLADSAELVLRESNEVFLEHVSRYFAKLLAEIAPLQATNGGPILLVQSEHAWTCSNDKQADRYLREITRFIRENGVSVPLTNANDLWQETPGTIDTWRGYDDLLSHVRQLRTLQPNAPRLVSAFQASEFETWGQGLTAKKSPGKALKARPETNQTKTPEAVLRRLAEILAGGGQPIVRPFHGGTNFGFAGGRIAGRPDGFIATRPAGDAPLGEAGTRGDKYHALRRLITFANHFGHVFAELDPDYQPTVFDPSAVKGRSAAPGRKTHQSGDHSVSVIPLRGSQGRVVFVFAPEDDSSSSIVRGTTLILDDGIRLPVDLGDQSVGWYAFDVDLQGLGRLDFASISPWAIVDRSIVVFQGPARASAYLSISGTPLEATVPADGAKPLVIEHRGLTIVICNQSQIDATYHDDSAVYVGSSGFDLKGAALPADGFPKAWIIRKQAQVENRSLGASIADSARSGRKPAPRTGRKADTTFGEWQAAPSTAYISGESARYASLEGPNTLSGCGATSGYGWYRIVLNGFGRKLCHIPQAADRLHLFMDSRRQLGFGVGPGTKAGPFELRTSKGPQTLVALVDNLGRFSEGNDLAEQKGLYGHIYEVRPMKAVKPKLASAKPVDPFTLRGFIAGRAAGQMSDTHQAIWTFAHTRKTPILIDVRGARPSGSFVLNDQPIAYYAGATGACFARILLDPRSTRGLKRGKNVLRFAPDLRQQGAAAELASATVLYECLDPLTKPATWAFAKWEPPAASTYSPRTKLNLKSIHGLPCWWRTTFEIASGRSDAQRPTYFDTTGLSKGQLYINGQNLGRYFTATADGRRVGPQVRLYVPGCWLKNGQVNELVLFDEHGFDPSRTRLVRDSGNPDKD